MAGVAQASASKVWRPARTTTYNANPLTITPVKGFGTGRLFIYANAAGTIAIQQKPRNSTGLAFTMRTTDSYSVTAAGTTQVFDFNVRGDYAQAVFTPTVGAPTVFEFEATFLP